MIVQYILNLQSDQKFSIRELSLQSGILQKDIVSTLQFMQVNSVFNFYGSNLFQLKIVKFQSFIRHILGDGICHQLKKCF